MPIAPRYALLTALLMTSAAACSTADSGAALTVLTDGDGQGNVISTNLPSIRCGLQCNAAFEQADVVQMEARPAPHSVFAGWTGDCEGDGACVVTMNNARRVTATFEREMLLLRVNPFGSDTAVVRSDPGGIECGEACESLIPYGTRVTMTAEPGSDARFIEWSGACEGTMPCGITMTSNRTLEAAFAPAIETLTVQTIGDGVVASTPAALNCGADSTCMATYDQGALVTLTAGEGVTSRFAGWGGDCSTSTTTQCRLTMTSSRAATARFDVALFDVRVSVQGNGTVTATPPGTACGDDCMRYAQGTSVRFDATSNGASTRFSSWSGACAGQAIGPVCTLTIDGNKSLTAVFTDDVFQLSVALDGAGRGTIESSPAGISCGATCTADFPAATRATLIATPTAGSEFAGWSGACIGSGDCTAVMTEARMVTARFDIALPTLTLTTFGSGSGRVTSSPGAIDCGSFCSARYAPGTTVVLTATPDAPPGSVSTFGGWTGACAAQGTTPTCTLTMAASQTAGVRWDGRFVPIPAGTFMRGSALTEPGREADEGPARTISITRRFQMKATEVTQAEWFTVMGTRPSTNAGCDECPVESVSHDDVIRYLNALSQQEGLPTCYSGTAGAFTFAGPSCTGYRLPTEAEWEYAARARTDTAFNSGDISVSGMACGSEPALETVARYCNNSSDPRPVSGLDANLFGVRDIHGNVAEWVGDWYSATYYSDATETADPLGPAAGTVRVVRGGAFDSLPRDCRSAARDSAASSAVRASIGFRTVRTE